MDLPTKLERASYGNDLGIVIEFSVIFYFRCWLIVALNTEESPI